MKIVKILFVSIAGLIALVVVAGVALFLVTSGEYKVPATVLGDDSLAKIEIQGVQLHAQSYGDPSDPTVVVLHGGPGGDYRSLLPLQELSGHHIVFYDQRGAGLSERVNATSLTLDDYLGELDAVIGHYANDQPVTLIGHSWGAMLAAAYMGVAPEKVARAVLMEPGFFTAEEQATWIERSGQYMTGLPFLKSAVLTGFEAQHVSGPDADASNDYLIGVMAHGFAGHPQNPYHCQDRPYDAPNWRFGATASQAAQAVPPADIDRVGEGARQFDGPVLMLASACNSWLGADLQATHQEFFENADLAVISESGHEMLWDNPEQTLAVIQEFLNAEFLNAEQ